MADAVAPQDVICRARQLIEEHGWIQATDHTDRGYCLRGALKAAMPKRLGSREHSALEATVFAYLGPAIGDEQLNGWTGVVEFNDAKRRTAAEVLEATRKAGGCD